MPLSKKDKRGLEEVRQLTVLANIDLSFLPKVHDLRFRQIAIRASIRNIVVSHIHQLMTRYYFVAFRLGCAEQQSSSRGTEVLRN